MKNNMSYFIPYVIENHRDGERSYDIYSRLLKDRIVFIGSEIESGIANSVIAQLLFLEKEDPDSDIIVYINSPGGDVIAGLGIYDTMKYIKPDVSTICVGLAASMGAILLVGGTKGKRYALKNSEIMIHQVSSGTSGQATDMEIHVKNTLRLKKLLNEILSENTGQPIEKVSQDTERDYFMNTKEALEYGIIDDIISKVSKDETSK